MEVLTTETRDQHNLEHLLSRSDFVSIHLPLTSGTRNLIGADAFALMKPTAILINTARGPIVDREALAQALHTGQIAAAALDVTSPEPLPQDDPLWQAPNLLVVPHIGSATWSARERMTEIAVSNILAGLDGKPLPYQVPSQLFD
jgi:glyoxylate reductase